MERLNIKDINNQIVSVDVVRYFRYKNTNYLIYTLHEADEKGFIKLYLVKIMKQFNEWIAKTIKDEEEWKQMQRIVKIVIKDIKDGNIDTFVDLSLTDIENIKIKEARFFKLDQKLTDILASNGVSMAVNNDNVSLEDLPAMEDIAPIKVEKIEQVEEITPVEPQMIEELPSEAVEQVQEISSVDVPEVNIVEPVASEMDDKVPTVDNVFGAPINEIYANEEIQRQDVKEEQIPVVEPITNESENLTDSGSNNLEDLSVKEIVVPVEEQQTLVEQTEPIVIEQDSIDDSNVDYKQLYLELQKDNDELNETMSDMLIELAEYRTKYGELEDN